MMEYVKDRLWKVFTGLIVFTLFLFIGVVIFLLSRFILEMCLDRIIPDNVMILSDDGGVDQILTHNSLIRLNEKLSELQTALCDSVYYWFFGVVFVVGFLCGSSWMGCQRNYTFRDFILKIDNEHDACYVYNQTKRLIVKRGWQLPKKDGK